MISELELERVLVQYPAAMNAMLRAKRLNVPRESQSTRYLPGGRELLKKAVQNFTAPLFLACQLGDWKGVYGYLALLGTLLGQSVFEVSGPESAFDTLNLLLAILGFELPEPGHAENDFRILAVKAIEGDDKDGLAGLIEQFCSPPQK